MNMVLTSKGMATRLLIKDKKTDVEGSKRSTASQGDMDSRRKIIDGNNLMRKEGLR